MSLPGEHANIKLCLVRFFLFQSYQAFFKLKSVYESFYVGRAPLIQSPIFYCRARAITLLFLF